MKKSLRFRRNRRNKRLLTADIFNIKPLSKSREAREASYRSERQRKNNKRYNLRETILQHKRRKLQNKSKKFRQRLYHAQKIINDAVNSLHKKNKKIDIFNDKSLQEKVFVIIRKQKEILEKNSQKKKNNEKKGKCKKRRDRLRGPFLVKNSQCHIPKNFKKIPVKVKKLLVEGKTQKIFNLTQAQNIKKGSFQIQKNKAVSFNNISSSIKRKKKPRLFIHPTKDINILKNPSKNIFRKIEDDIGSIARKVSSRRRKFTNRHAFSLEKNISFDKSGVFSLENQTRHTFAPFDYSHYQLRNSYEEEESGEIETKLSQYFEKFVKNNQRIKSSIGKKLKRSKKSFENLLHDVENKSSRKSSKKNNSKRKNISRHTHLVYRKGRKLNSNAQSKNWSKKSINSWKVSKDSRENILRTK